jgi:hypothetical protein
VNIRLRFSVFAVLALAGLVLSACSFQNKYEKQADAITNAVLANNLAPVQDQLAKGVNVSRVKVAEWSDELNDQGKLESIKEVQPCDPGAHCFKVTFEKHVYNEEMALDENGKVTHWTFRMADAAH